MPKCKAIKTNYLPCEKEALVAGKGVCGIHRTRIAVDTAKEEARLADNMSALTKAADRTSTAFALMTITPTPGTEREYANAKQEEALLKTRVKTENDKYNKDLMTQKCKEVASRKLHELLNLETDTTQTCYAIPSSQNVQCTSASSVSGSSHDHLCDTHRTMLVNNISVLSMNQSTAITSNMVPFHFASDLNNQLLFDAFREAVRVARFTRFGSHTAPPAVAAVPPPRRIAAEPVLTAPVDIAPHIAKQHLEMSLALEKPITCPICYDAVTAETIVMTHCGHVYCTPCLTAARQRERKCPQCRVTI